MPVGHTLDQCARLCRLLSDFKTNYQAIAPYALSRDYFVEIVLRNTELLNVSYKMFQLTQLLETKGEQALPIERPI